MGTLDSVLVDVGSQFAISNSKTTHLLSGLLSLFTGSPGGLDAFLDRLRQAGLSSVVSSWLYDSSPRPITNNALESAIGRDTIDKIASKAGLSFTTASSALAYMLPNIVHRLTPGGVIPTRLPLDIIPSISSATSAIATGTRQVALTSENAIERSNLPAFRWPLLLAILGISLFGYWLWNSRASVPNSTFNVEEQVHLAGHKATAALGALRPGFTVQDLVSALNLNVINFPTGSAQIPADQIDFLNKVAAAIKSAPANTAIEIGGHTDNIGDSGANLVLSQQRADAIRNYLVQQGVNPNALIAKGYGDARPVGSNNTDEGKFRNRRIEFTVR
jgi:outer membrane protein OmpA-like peptidoglycan-associated protein/uncharacterized protein YidB (DUF937 family)